MSLNMCSYDSFSDYEDDEFDIFDSWGSGNNEYVGGFNQVNTVLVDQDFLHERESDSSSDASTSLSKGSSTRYHNDDSVSYRVDASPADTSLHTAADENYADLSNAKCPSTSECFTLAGSLGHISDKFSSSLEFSNYHNENSVGGSDCPLTTDSAGSSRYSRALRLLKEKRSKIQENVDSHQLNGNESGTLHNGHATPMKDEVLYDMVSRTLLNECSENRLLTPEDFSISEDETNTSNEFTAYDDVSHYFTPRDIVSQEGKPEISKITVNREVGTTAGVYDIQSKGNLQGNQSRFAKLKEQVSVFHARVKVANYSLSLTSQRRLQPSPLEEHLTKINNSYCHSNIIEMISFFTDAITKDQNLATSFLSHYITYIRSIMDLDSSLISVNDFLVCFHPCVEAAMGYHLDTTLKTDFKNAGVLTMLYNSLKKMMCEETKFGQVNVNEITEYKPNCSIKAHIVRLQPTQSQELFQETFSDSGNHADLYLIYIWRILKLYSVEDTGSGESSVICLSEAMEQSGKYVSVISVKEVNERESKIQFHHMKENILKEDNTQISEDLSYEWVDFRVGQIYENGVAFLTNMNSWIHQLKEISSSIDKLEVKKSVKFMPALGSTFGLHLEDGLRVMDKVEDVKYIRTRVVRLAGPVVRLYGIDTGNVFVSDVSQLLLLPAPLLNIPPCGRLAHLPVVPAPNAEALSPTLNLLVALTRCKDLTKDLTSMDVRFMATWLQVPKLTHTVLRLLRAMLVTAGDSSLMNDICCLITDYLLRITTKEVDDGLCTYKALSILISAMETSPKIRLLLAREGAFVTLSDLGLRVGNPQVWDVLRLLLGGKGALESWLSVSDKISQLRNRRSYRPWRLESNPALESDKQNNGDISVAVIRIAAMPNLDRNWDLEVRTTIRSRQYVPYCDPSGWHWGRQEVVAAVNNDLHYGHKLDVLNDETHHIILDKSIPNIRMNTLLQIILGMLNTGLGGKIYIGLNNLGVVQGVRMTRDQRDCFMLGFSKLVTSEISPMVLPCDSLIQFIPVVRPGLLPSSAQSTVSGLVSSTSDASVYVVILTVRPQPNLLYRYRSDPESVFMREGGMTSNIKGHRLSQLNVTLISRCRHLQHQVSMEKQALLKQVICNEA